ncbi:DHH family phosphoesterase [Natrinema salsiterrestre]|uniref:Uncharacterized protein n=1 Tax=Natrinema salsiterrestre TaxID=2950540 RepID=A0A9Q4L1M9_9EURY|nr:hypothetical protein [Natrinema salsiterrestre]MDF9748420.1 hypothetical protein [Natrinema salsiterrestre]
MIDDALLSRETLDYDEWVQTPQPEHLVPDSIERKRAREQFRSRLNAPTDAVVISHTDADGLSSAALLTNHLERTLDTIDVAVKTIDYNGPYRFEHVVEDLLETGVHSTPIFISDFALDNESVVDDLGTLANARDCSIIWYDHHQWDEGLVADLEAAGISVVIDEDECAASLIERELGPFDDLYKDLAECTKDIDLWIKDDPRSERLNVFASLVDGPWEYIDVVLEHGANLPDDVQERIDERLERDRELEQAAIENRVVYGVGGYDVAITYVRGGRSNQIGNDLVEEMDHDIAIIQKPHGGMGIYSHSDRETFAKCHEIADQLGGGGHPTAAGCEVPVETFRDLADFWKTCGVSVREDLLEAVIAVVNEDGDPE